MTETKYAHEIVPHPEEGEAKPLDYLARYHYAQAQAWHLSFTDAIHEGAYGAAGCDFTLAQCVGHSHRALIFDALAQGLNGQDAADWSSTRNHSESAEWIWERGVVYGLNPAEILPYEWQRKAVR